MATITGLVLLGAAGVAQADPVTLFGYNLNTSFGGAYAPTYEGGKRYTVFPTGSLAITHPWEFDAFSAPDDAASLALINTRHFSFGAALSLRENRGNDDELAGMRNIGWAFQAGGFMNVWPTNWLRLHVEALKGVTAESGLLVNTGADFVKQSRKWTVSAGPRFSWADNRFNGTYFGVSPAEAAASPYIIAPYRATGGPHYAGIQTSAEYKWIPRWRLTAQASYTRLLSDDAGSPLVRQLGSVNQFDVGVGVRFMLSD
jgi:outer membrane protein